MMRGISVSLKVVAGVALVCVLQAVPASAQANRTWVSAVGDDVNPCSRTAPCKTFAGAISRTAAGGEINVLDPGGYGGVTITKSISIISTFEAGVLVSGTNGIIINVAAADRVLLDGLDIEGLGTGLNGVRILGSGRTMIRNSSIRNFTQNGVSVEGTAGARVYVENSRILNCNGGIFVQGASGAVNAGVLQDSILDSNVSFATSVGTGASMILIGSTLTGSPSSIVTSGGGQVISYGNNVLRNAGAPTQTLVLQ